MRIRCTALALVVALPLLGCGDGDDVELEPGPATESVPGAAGSMSMDQWDTDPDEIITRAEFDRWWDDEGVYAAWDTDADRELGAEELATGIFGTWDADQTGTLTPEEWGRGVDSYHGQRYGSWEDWDQDHDRQLSQEEVAAGLERHGLFPDVDPDGDGEVTEQELADWWFALHDADDSGALEPGEWRAMLEEWRQREG